MRERKSRRYADDASRPPPLVWSMKPFSETPYRVLCCTRGATLLLGAQTLRGRAQNRTDGAVVGRSAPVYHVPACVLAPRDGPVVVRKERKREGEARVSYGGADETVPSHEPRKALASL